MGRVKSQVKRLIATVPLLIVLFCLSCSGGKKPEESVLREREVLFTAYTHALSPGEALYLTSERLGSAPLVMEDQGDCYQASAVVTGDCTYRYVVGDEWGNIYRGVKYDSAGDRRLAADETAAEDVIETFVGSFELPSVQISLMITTDAPRLFIAGELTQGEERELKLISSLSGARHVFGGDFAVIVGKHDFRLYVHPETASDKTYSIVATKDNTLFPFEIEFGREQKDVGITVVTKTELSSRLSLWLMATGDVNFGRLQKLTPLTYRICLTVPLTEAYRFVVYLGFGDNVADIIFDPIAEFTLNLYSAAEFTCYMDNF